MLAEQPRSNSKLTREHELQLRQVLYLAETWNFDREHTLHVAWLAQRLFDELQPAHRLSERDRFWLLCGSILHDIGRGEVGGKGHHKASLRIVVRTPILQFDLEHRRIIGSVARYHRKALPSQRHVHYAALAPVQRQIVCQLAALLRLADALDKSHQLVSDISFTISPTTLHGRCFLRSPASAAERERLRRKAAEKGAFLAKVLERRLELEFIHADARGWDRSSDFVAGMNRLSPARF